MPRRATPATTLTARLRAYFGLERAELALYLGVSPTLMHYLDSGQRRLTGTLFAALEPLVRYLPPADEDNPAPPMPLSAVPGTTGPASPPGLPAPDAEALGYRGRVCQQQADRVAQELTQLSRQAAVAQRWATALPALLPTPEATAADPGRAAWLTDWLRRRARPLPPAAATRWHLLRARQAALHAELAALGVARTL